MTRIVAIVLAALTLTCVSVSGQTPSFCKKYASILFNNNTANPTPGQQYQLIEAVVMRALLGCNSTNLVASYGGPCIGLGNVSSVTGLVDVGSNNRAFFDGSAPAWNLSLTGAGFANMYVGIPLGTGGSTKFVNLTTATVNNIIVPHVGLNPAGTLLVTHLVEWFGGGLGCDAPATSGSNSVSGIAPYTGYGNMRILHANMNITKPVWDGFVTALTGSLLSYGVNATDVSTTVVSYAATFLRVDDGTSEIVICNDPSCDCATGYTKSTDNKCLKAATTAPTGPTTASGPTTTPVPTNAPGSTATSIIASPLILVTAITAVVLM